MARVLVSNTLKYLQVHVNQVNIRFCEIYLNLGRTGFFLFFFTAGRYELVPVLELLVLVCNMAHLSVRVRVFCATST